MSRVSKGPELPGIKAKLQYLWDYYKLPLVIICIFLYLVCYRIYGHMTYKETVLYTGLINVSPGETLTGQLSDGFLDYLGADASKNRLTLYTGLYLTDDSSSEYHQYTYASRLKILASIDAAQLDVVLMNQEAFDAFAQNGYLYNLEDFLSSDPDLSAALAPYLRNNLEILEDNAQDLAFDPSLEYVSKTREYPMALDLSCSDMIADAGFSDTVYLGVIANTPRPEAVREYLRYLLS